MGRTDAEPSQERDQSPAMAPATPKEGTKLLRRNSWSFDRLGDLKGDLIVLRHLWLSNLVPGGKKSTDTHAQRLESSYGPQAAACECGGGVAAGWPKMLR